MSVKDTSQSSPDLHVAGAMSHGIAGYVEGMEAAGPRQLADSDVIPTDGYDDAELEALGFTLGPPVADDPLFRTCELPPGWSREAANRLQCMIRDERGYGRFDIFYKAAFYDRRAFAIIVRFARTKAQEEAWESIATSIGRHGVGAAQSLWVSAGDRRDGDDYVYCWRGRCGTGVDGHGAYDDDGRRLEVQVAPDGSVVDRREFTVKPER